MSQPWIQHPWRRLLSRISRIAATQLDALDFLEREQAAAMVPQRVLDLATLERRILLNAVPAAAIDDAALVMAAAQPTLAEMAVVTAQEAVSSGPAVAAATAEDTNESPERRELIVLEAGIENFETLLDELRRVEEPGVDRELLVLDADDDVETISAALHEGAAYDAVHLLVHGSERAARFGGEWVLFDGAESANEFAAWGTGLNTGADLLFYSCDTAETVAGRDWLASVADLTGADVAASSNATGAAALGGDWTLEYQHGAIEAANVASMADVEDWRGLLATFTVTSTDDNGAGTLRQAILDANALSGLDTISFSISSGAQVIQLSTVLPSISEEVVIDATSQPGYGGTPLIWLDGQNVAGDGLTLEGSGSTITGLVVSRFGGNGIVLSGTGGHTVRGNWIGLDSAGLTDDGNGADGIAILAGSDGNTVGGTLGIQRNLIAGNDDDGISVRSSSNTIYGNWIGLNVDGTAVGNDGDGVSIEGATGVNTIGGVGAGQANKITANGGRGVSVASGTNVGTAIRGNSIWGNSGLGIDLGADNVTANDIGDGDAGANNLLNKPVLFDATPGASSTAIRGTWTGAAGTSVTIDFYAATTVGTSVNPQAGTWLGSTSVTADANGVATFNATVSTTVGVNQALTATATETAVGTSELATAVAALPSWNKLYWIDRTDNTLERINLDGSNRQTLVSGLTLGHAAAIDLRAGQIYYVDQTPNRINRVGLDGTGATTIATSTGGTFASLAIDSVNSHIYYTMADNNIVGRVGFDGMNDTTIVSLTGAKELLYSEGLHTLFYSDDTTIYRRDLTTGGTTTLASGLGLVSSLVLDERESRLYFADYGAGLIRRVGIDGTGLTTIVSGESEPAALAIDPRRDVLYWSDDQNNRIRSARFDGTNAAHWESSVPYADDLFFATISGNETDPTTSGLSNVTVSQGAGPTNVTLSTAFNDLESGRGGLSYQIFANTNAALFQNVLIDQASSTLRLAYDSGQSGSSTLVVRATDAAGRTVDASFQVQVNSTNTAPTISTVSPQQMGPGATLGPLAFTVGDAQTAAGSLVVTATSSSQTRIADGSIVLGGSGANRTVTVTSVGNAPVGATTITLTVSDGSLTAQSQFVVTIQTGTPTAVADGYTMSEDGALSIPSAGGVLANDTDPQSLPLTAVLVAGPSNAASFTLNTNGSFNYTPTANFNGTDTFTYRASNGTSQSSVQTVTFTVNAVNDAPTITTITNRTLPRNQSTGAIAFTVGDAETSAGSLTVTASSSNTAIIPNGNITIGGTGANRTVTVTAASNATLGTATITVTVGDGSASTPTTFNVTVTLAAPNTTADTFNLSEDGTLSTSAGWWNTDWTRRQRLTFNNAAATEALTDFPVLVTLNTSRIDYSLVKANGDDLRFTDSAGNLLAYEIATWNPSGTSTVWVKAPTIAAGSTTDFVYVYYGNATATAGANATAVWSNGFRAVYHLDDSGATIKDSTSNAFNGTNFETTATTGRVGGARNFDGVNDRINLGSARAFLNGVTGATFSILARPDSVTGDRSMVGVSIFTGDGTTPVSTARGQLALKDGSVRSYARATDAGTSPTIQSGAVATTGSWQLFTTVINYQAGTVSQYRNGSLLGTSTVTFAAGTTPGTNSNSAFLGSELNGGAWYFDGLLDEARIAGVARSSSWVAADNLSQTDTFVTYASAEALPGVLANDSDPTGLPITAVLVSGPSNAASFTLNANGTFSYTPNPNYAGTDTFTYRATNGTTPSAPVTVTLNVAAINDAPTLPGFANETINEDGITPLRSFTVSDVDTSGGSLTVTASSSNQALIPDANINLWTTGTGANSRSFDVQMSPLLNASGTATITLTASDGLLTTQQVFTVTVNPVNDAPAITGLAHQIRPHSTPFLVGDVNIADVDSPLSNLTITATSSNQSLVTDNSIVVAGTGATRSVAIRPAANVTGTATITLVVSDGVLSSQTTFDVTLTNAAPTAVADTYTVNEDHVASMPAGWWNDAWQARTRLTFNNAAATETLADFPVLVKLDTSRLDYSLARSGGEDLRFIGSGGNELSYDIASWNPGGTSLVWVKVPTIAANNSTGIWMYYGNPDATVGARAWEVWSNGFGAVYHMDTGGVSVADASTHGRHGTAVNGAGMTLGAIGFGRTLDGANDAIALPGQSDIISSAREVTLSTWVNPTVLPGGPADLFAISRYEAPGNQAIDSSRALFYLDSNGRIAAGGRSTDTETFRGTTSGNNVITANEWQLVSAVIDFAGDRVSIYRNGTLVHTAAVSFDATSTPATSSNSIALGADDDLASRRWTGGMDEARIARQERSGSWIRADYLSQTDAFVSYGAAEVRPSVLSNDTDANGGQLRAILVSGPSNASSFTLLANGMVHYTPNADYFGSDSFTYQVSDGIVTSAPVTVTINVTPVQDPVRPNGLLGSSANEDAGPQTVNAAAGFIDPDLPGADTITYSISGNTNAGLFSSLSIDSASGVVTYESTANASGAALVTIRAVDAVGNIATNVLAVSITPVNDAPTVTAIADQTIDEDTTTGLLAFTIGDVDNPLSALTITAGSCDPTLVPASGIIVAGTGANRTIRVNPARNEFGGPIAITIYVSDGTNTTQQSFQLTVRPVNDDPTVTVPPVVIIDEDHPETIALTIGDVETAAEDLTVSITSTNQNVVPDSGLTLGGTGANRTFTIHPAANQYGSPILLNLSISDGTSVTLRTITLTVRPVNDPVQTTGLDDLTVAEDTTGLIVDLKRGFSDIETPSDSLRYVVLSNNNPGLFTSLPISSTGILSLNLAADAVGAAELTIQASDPQGTTVTTSFQVTVTPVDDAPRFAPLQFSPESLLSSTVTGNILARTSEVDGQPVTLRLRSGPASGTVVFNTATGVFTYTPGTTYAAVDTFTVEASDGGLTTVGTVTVNLPIRVAAPTSGSTGSSGGSSGSTTSGSGTTSTSSGSTSTSTGSTSTGTSSGSTTTSSGSTTTTTAATTTSTASTAVTSVATTSIVATNTAPSNAPLAPVPGAVPLASDVGKGTVGTSVTPMLVGPTPTSSVMSVVGSTSSRDDDNGSDWGATHTGSSGGITLQSGSSKAIVSVEVRGSMLREWSLSSSRFTDEYVLPSLDSLSLNYQSVQPLSQSRELHTELAKVEQDLSQSFKSDTFVVGSAVAVTSGLSVGYVIWLVRGGLIMTSLLAQVPAWQDIDPLTVLDSRGLREEDGESLQSMIETSDDDELIMT